MYRVTLLEKEEILSFKELKDYENTFAYIESLIKQLGKNRKIIVHEKRNDKWEKFGEWKLEQ
ncbi:hypothetical protein HS141_13015 [Cetobacterium somerae]|uniref:hypothetical protein n=1 Tax=Cetobacterium TaxID=180162 RepID=UPI0006462185|nr:MULTISPECIES: hypothetical protein [Cetobacterium]MCQ9627845.1 hypothetical protein [Cetobacterium somerae]WVJ03362.1 hypothetical protein VSU16_16370 [Cetobacterium somerae]